MRWWRWEQRSLNRQRKQVNQDLGARAGQQLLDLGLNPDAQGLFTVLCPSCRCGVFQLAGYSIAIMQSCILLHQCAWMYWILPEACKKMQNGMQHGGSCF